MVDVARLEAKARWVRLQTFEMIARAGAGHIGGSFSSTDILVALYYGGILAHDPSNPRWNERDRLIASKGHGSLALYPILADRGFFPVELLDGYASKESFLSGHPDTRVPGIETVTGSLGHGLGIGAGIALGARLKGESHRVFVLLGDGECQEGSIWESAFFSAQHELDKLVAIVDNNGITATDFTASSMAVEPLDKKWQAAGWQTSIVDGHSIEQIIDELNRPATDSRQPKVILARTVKGKGVSFMENDPAWHHGVPKGEQIERARAELS